MIDYRGLFRIAGALATGSVGVDGGRLGRPREMDLRGAVSKSYYAMFHALAQTCADTLVGSSAASRNLPAWRQTYRALNHGYARRQCNRPRLMNQFPDEVRDFGEKFVEMQRNRHGADYNPFPQNDLRREQVLRQIAEVERVTEEFLALPAADRRAFSVYVLLPVRSD